MNQILDFFSFENYYGIVLSKSVVSNVLTERHTSNFKLWTNLIANIYFPRSSTIVFWSVNRPVSPDALLDFFRKRKGKVGGSIESNWIENCTFCIFTYLSEIPIQAFLDFCGFNFRGFRFTAVYNSILFSSPLVLLSNLDLCGFCFRFFFVCVSPH